MHQRVLHHVLGGRLVPDNIVSESHQRIVKAAHQAVESLAVARPYIVE